MMAPAKRKYFEELPRFGPQIPSIATVSYTWEILQNHTRGCQNYGPFLGPLHTTCPILLRIQHGTIILRTTPHIGVSKQRGGGEGAVF